VEEGARRLEPTELSVFFDKKSRKYYMLDLGKVRYSMYHGLRSVYNSLRYFRTQLHYGRQLGGGCQNVGRAGLKGQVLQP